MSREITAAPAGEVVQVRGPMARITPVMIWNRCRVEISLGYACETHLRTFPTLEAFVEHLNDESLEVQDHRNVAVYCPEHQTFEAMPEEQLRALTGAAA